MINDTHPTSAEYVYTTRQAAVGLSSGDMVQSNQHVYLVLLRGHFKDRDAYVPEGKLPPSGTTAYFTVDGASHMVLDFGIYDKTPDMTKLGAVHAVRGLQRSS